MLVSFSKKSKMILVTDRGHVLDYLKTGVKPGYVSDLINSYEHTLESLQVQNRTIRTGSLKPADMKTQTESECVRKRLSVDRCVALKRAFVGFQVSAGGFTWSWCTW